ncbi:MAG: SMC-Scp complex subunit ScpB [Spirochaetota bacterium]
MSKKEKNPESDIAAQTEDVLTALDVMQPGAAEAAAEEGVISAEALADAAMAAKVIEAIIFIEGSMSLHKLHRILRIEKERIRSVIASINERNEASGSGIEIIEVGDSVKMIPSQRIYPILSKVYGRKKKTKLSRTILQTLAIIAYRQPITKAEIDDIRQADSGKQISFLMQEGFVEYKGRKDILHKPQTFGTTEAFLIHFGLRSLEDLPKLRELKELDLNRADE